MTNFAPYFINMYVSYSKIPVVILILAVALGFVTTGCDNEEVPEGILPKEQLTNIMIDFYLSESRLNGYSISKDSARKLFIPYEDSVLMKYGVSDSALQKTYQYYFDHPIELEKIYEVVIDSLSLRERKAVTSERTAK